MSRRDPRTQGGGIDRNASGGPSKPPEAASVTDAQRDANASKPSGSISRNASGGGSVSETHSAEYEKQSSTSLTYPGGPISSNRSKK